VFFQICRDFIFWVLLPSPARSSRVTVPIWLSERARGWRVQCACGVAPKPSFTSTLQELMEFREFCKSIKIAKFCAFLVLQALASLMSYFLCAIGLLICSRAIARVWLLLWPHRIFWKLVFPKPFKSNLAIHGPLFSRMHFRIGRVSQKRQESWLGLQRHDLQIMTCAKNNGRLSVN